MVRFALRHGGMAQLRALVRASGAHRPLAPVLGEPPDRLVAQAWAAYARWFAGHHPPAVYLTPRMWMWSNGGIRWVGQVYGFGLPPGQAPTMTVDGQPFQGTVPKVTSAGDLSVTIPAGARTVVVDGLTARPAPS